MNVGTSFEFYAVPTFPSVALGFISICICPFLSFSALITLLFSAASALIVKAAYLTENTGQTPISNSLIFNQSRTLLHFFPGSPLLSIRSPKHTGGIPPILSDRRSRRPRIDEIHRDSLVFTDT